MLTAIVSVALVIQSCSYNNDDLGADILPPGDSVNMVHDTIFDIAAYPVRGFPQRTSENVFEPTTNRLMILGSLQDSVFGTSEATIVTQFNTTTVITPGTNTMIDTVMLSIYIAGFEHDQEDEYIISVYELSERIYMDTTYYSDINMSNRYDPVPLVVKTVTPEAGESLDLKIDDQEFIDKLALVLEDTTIFNSDSLFKDVFNGLYITAESQSASGNMAFVQMNNTETSLAVRYTNDTLQLDLIKDDDYLWANFTIDQYYSQKINVFEHDYTGTELDVLLDNENAVSSYAYLQGLAGVDTRFSFTNLEEWMARSPVVINTASLVFDVVPEDLSGVAPADLPDRLLFYTRLANDSLENVYDYHVNLLSDGYASAFGGFKKANSQGMFYSDSTYSYRFNMGLHFQYMLEGVKSDNDFILQLSDSRLDPKFSRLWSNLSTNEQRIRLEIVYLKL